MSNDYMRWSPDREPNPRPIHGWDPPMDPELQADVPFQETDDPEGAKAWLEDRLNQTQPDPVTDDRLNHRMINVPIPPERRNLRPEGYQAWDEGMTPDQMRRIQALPNGELTVSMDPTRDRRMDDGYYVRAEDPHYRPPVPASDPRTAERPNFPFGPMRDVAQIVVIIRRDSGLEETYEIEPTDVQFHMEVEVEHVEIGNYPLRIVEGLRELRRVVILVGLPRNWRRLGTRRWR
jgi:hypothetical protein